MQHWAPVPTHTFLTHLALGSRYLSRLAGLFSWPQGGAGKASLDTSLDPAARQHCTALPFGSQGCLEDLPGKRTGISHLKTKPSVCSTSQGIKSFLALGRESVGRSHLNGDTGRSTLPARKGMGWAPRAEPPLCPQLSPSHTSPARQPFQHQKGKACLPTQLLFLSSGKPGMTFHLPQEWKHKTSLFSLSLSKRVFGAKALSSRPTRRDLLLPKPPACQSLLSPFCLPLHSSLLPSGLRLLAGTAWQYQLQNGVCRPAISPFHPSSSLARTEALTSCPRGSGVACCHISIPSDGLQAQFMSLTRFKFSFTWRDVSGTQGVWTTLVNQRDIHRVFCLVFLSSCQIYRRPLTSPTTSFASLFCVNKRLRARCDGKHPWRSQLLLNIRNVRCQISLSTKGIKKPNIARVL